MEASSRRAALDRLGEIPRASFVFGPTPLLDAPNLTRSYGGERRTMDAGEGSAAASGAPVPTTPPILLKMDAWSGPGLGGNKVRKLEYLLSPPALEGIDTLITSGSAQSNHARVTAALAARLGLRCILVLNGDPGSPPRGNALLHRLLGAEIRQVEAPEERAPAVERAAEEVEAGGGVPLAIPVGASTPLGSLGYVAGALELDRQLTGRGLRSGGLGDRGPLWIVVATSSCGTAAGLCLGFTLLGREDVRILAVSADLPGPEIRSEVDGLARGAGSLLGWEGELLPDLLHPTDSQVGAGYGIPTEASHEAIHRWATLEGVVLDPTYTAKAAAGLVEALDAGRFDGASAVVFLHTGGHPALVA